MYFGDGLTHKEVARFVILEDEKVEVRRTVVGNEPKLVFDVCGDHLNPMIHSSITVLRIIDLGVINQLDLLYVEMAIAEVIVPHLHLIPFDLFVDPLLLLSVIEIFFIVSVIIFIDFL